ncbi:uncharacterized protein PADG_12298 [Paracoccidioides brasiliensis Pb18]|uniref:Uncharacterized protein n=1 Tax=Paracoccidioides brasiliensis (strain Pb18) TaxID=502780 RepID=A0A0A0HQY0_PARBD|nr:uncharacterized protein PADG_12298 [Paracoccidioides brasiliensis Pb18]KGM91614.1 hypothetical protein PADG_12298 [Paracoccidioides brasiliensis Pb18]
MVKEITKIRAKTSTDDELLKECKEEAECNTCDSITWTEPMKGTRIDPPPNTVAVVVDLIHTRGAIPSTRDTDHGNNNLDEVFP